MLTYVYKGICHIYEVIFSLILNITLELRLELTYSYSLERGNGRKVTFKGSHLLNLYIFLSSPCSLKSHKAPKPPNPDS